jgi:hypothetical protein
MGEVLSLLKAVYWDTLPWSALFIGGWVLVMKVLRLILARSEAEHASGDESRR